MHFKIVSDGLRYSLRESLPAPPGRYGARVTGLAEEALRAANTSEP
jgi:hypothetical protein